MGPLCCVGVDKRLGRACRIGVVEDEGTSCYVTIVVSVLQLRKPKLNSLHHRRDQDVVSILDEEILEGAMEIWQREGNE
jgi:hypothetical protein